MRYLPYFVIVLFLILAAFLLMELITTGWDPDRIEITQNRVG